MEFFLGVLVGILFSMLNVVILISLKDPIERRLRVMYELLPRVKEKGDVIEPESDIEIAQNRIIEENKKRGRDTNVSEIIAE